MQCRWPPLTTAYENRNCNIIDDYYCIWVCFFLFWTKSHHAFNTSRKPNTTGRSHVQGIKTILFSLHLHAGRLSREYNFRRYFLRRCNNIERIHYQLVTRYNRIGLKTVWAKLKTISSVFTPCVCTPYPVEYNIEARDHCALGLIL